MKFDISDIRRMISSYAKKPKRRNVVHTIGYNKFSPQEIIRKTKMFISDDYNKRKVKEVISKSKKFIFDEKNKDRVKSMAGSFKRFVNNKK